MGPVDAAGVVVGLEVADDDGAAVLAAEFVHRAGEERRLAGAGGRNEVQGEDAAPGEEATVAGGGVVILREEGRVDLDREGGERLGGDGRDRLRGGAWLEEPRSEVAQDADPEGDILAAAAFDAHGSQLISMRLSSSSRPLRTSPQRALQSGQVKMKLWSSPANSRWQAVQ